MFKTIDEVLQVYKGYVRKSLKITKRLRAKTPQDFIQEDHESFAEIINKLLIAKELFNLSTEEIKAIENEVKNE